MSNTKMTLKRVQSSEIVSARITKCPPNPYAEGYGSKIPTQYMVRLTNNREYRVYCMCYSNSGSIYILRKGVITFIDEYDIKEKLTHVDKDSWVPVVYDHDYWIERHKHVLKEYAEMYRKGGVQYAPPLLLGMIKTRVDRLKSVYSCKRRKCGRIH